MTEIGLTHQTATHLQEIGVDKVTGKVTDKIVAIAPEISHQQAGGQCPTMAIETGQGQCPHSEGMKEANHRTAERAHFQIGWIEELVHHSWNPLTEIIIKIGINHKLPEALLNTIEALASMRKGHHNIEDHHMTDLKAMALHSDQMAGPEMTDH